MKVILKTLSNIRSHWPATVVLNPGTSLIGSGTNCTVKLSCPSVSKWHCTVDVAPNAIYVTDLHSLNGTYVNDRRAIRQVLHHADHLGIGDLLFMVHADESTELSSASAPADFDLPALPGRPAASVANISGTGGSGFSELLPRPLQALPGALSGRDGPTFEFAPAELVQQLARYEKALENCSAQLRLLARKVTALEAKLNAVALTDQNAQIDRSPGKAFESHDAMMYIARAAVREKVRQQHIAGRST